MSPVGVAEDESGGDAEGGGRHESIHDKGEGASALFRWGDRGGDGRRGGGEHTRADCSKDAGTQCYAECWGEGGECVAEDEDDKARPERVAGADECAEDGGAAGEGDAEDGDQLCGGGRRYVQVGADFFEESGEDKGVGAHSEGHEREGP